MALTLTDTQQASGTLAFVDKHGHTTDAASVSVSTTDPAVATTSYDDSTNTVTVVAVAPGVTALTISATNSAGAVLPFEDVAIEVAVGDATSGTITFGAPVEQPA